MKKLILLLLITGSVYSQKHVYNVQRYCVDEKPFKKGECNISGNEYSFVFMDVEKKEVVFFFTDMRLEYKIVDSYIDLAAKDYTHYLLENKSGRVDMKINKQQNKMEFLYPDSHIYLTVGKSTKLQ